MSLGIAGNYVLRLSFGQTTIPLVISGLDEITVIQDMERFLPSLSIRMADPSGVFTHVQPFDKEMSRVSLEFGSATGDLVTNTFPFIIYRRFPEAVNLTSSMYEAGGLLNIPNLFNPTPSRATRGLVSDIIASIAMDELLVDGVDISPALQVDKVVLQPSWSNADLFRYLKKTLGDELGYAYKPFIYVKDSKITFNFRSLEDMTQSNPLYNFIVNDEPFNDYIPVMDYKIIDNYNVLGVEGIKIQEYGYFDYENSQFVIKQDTYQDFFSLSDYLMVDVDDSGNSQTIFDTGRANDFSPNFVGRVRSEYYTRLNNLTKIWITTWGLPNIIPGNVVKLLFAQGVVAGSLATYQYSGYWMVQRVVHTFGKTYLTKLLLTRAGVDTDQSTSLVKAIRSTH